MSTPQDKVIANLQVNVSPAEQSFQSLQDSYDKLINHMSAKPLGLTAAKGSDTYIQDATGAVRTLQQQIKNLQLSFKEGTLSAQDLFNKLGQLKTAYADAFDTTTKSGISNDTALRSAMVSAQDQISKLNDFEMQSEHRLIAQKEAADAAYQQQYAAQLAQQESDYQKQLKLEESAKATSIDSEMKAIKAFYDMKLSTAQDSLAKMESLINTETDYFIANQDKRLQALKTTAALEDAANAQSAKSSQTYTSSSGGSSYHSGIGGGVGLVGMGAMMAEFTGISMLAQNIRTGLVDITKQQQGLEQVFGTNISSQRQLNDVTNQFIGIAEKYGASVTDVLDASKQWGRQYHDVATAQALVNSSTLLSIVDNMNMTDSAKALEATMNALGMSVKNASEAQASSMSIVDQWSIGRSA